MMNTNGLVKHYDLLTPRERLPLILAAFARGDEQERARLVKSAPRRRYSVQDHAGLTEAYFTLCITHLLEVTELAAQYLLVLGQVAREEGEDEDGVVEGALLLGYLLKTRLAGWRLFCAEHRFPRSSTGPGCRACTRSSAPSSAPGSGRSRPRRPASTRAGRGRTPRRRRPPRPSRRS